MNTSRMPTPTKVHLEDNCLSVEITMNDALIYFPGHFAKHSILPGVIILDWVMELSAEYLGVKAAVPMQMEVIKFKHIVESDTHLLLEIKHLVDKNKISYSLHSEKGDHSSGRVVVEPIEAQS